jgi:hypothetical protein
VTTTIHTTTTAPPAWLNLDIVPPEVRERIAKANELVEAFLADGRFDALCREVYETGLAFHAAIDGMNNDGAFEAISEASGYNVLMDRAATVEAFAHIAVGEGPRNWEGPTWFRGYGAEAHQ